MAVLHKSISALDREKDALQDEVDQKTETLVAVQEDNTKKVDETNKPHQDPQAYNEGEVKTFSNLPLNLLTCKYIHRKKGHFLFNIGYLKRVQSTSNIQ